MELNNTKSFSCKSQLVINETKLKAWMSDRLCPIFGDMFAKKYCLLAGILTAALVELHNARKIRLSEAVYEEHLSSLTQLIKLLGNEDLTDETRAKLTKYLENHPYLAAEEINSSAELLSEKALAVQYHIYRELRDTGFVSQLFVVLSRQTSLERN